MPPKLVIIMVGLPARGKSYISKKLARYLNWLQLETRVFNAGQTRREAKTPNVERHSSDDILLNHPANFFDPDNAEAVTRRDEIALSTLDDLLCWLQQPSSSVGILDATNSTVQRRQTVLERIQRKASPGLELLFLESCCFDHNLLEKNIRLKLSGPDYKQHGEEDALADFRRRIVLYEKSYTSMDISQEEVGFPYLQLVDVGRRVIVNCINGFLSARATEYLLNFRLHERQIWITRNGESLDDVEERIGRSSPLSCEGAKFACALTAFVKEKRRIWEMRQKQAKNARPYVTRRNLTTSVDTNQLSSGRSFQVWTSIMAQAVATSRFFDENDYKISHIRMLNDLHAGMMEGLTFADISRIHGNEITMRQQNPVYYRWPGSGGESYADVIQRLRPIIMELERMEDHVLLITHRAVARVMLAYFQEMNWDAITDVEVPLGRVFCIEPRPYGVTVESYQYDQRTEEFEHIRQN